MANSENRFEVTYRQGSLRDGDINVMVDRLTGVNYLILKNGNQVAYAMPLLDRDGKPLVTGNGAM